MGSPLWNLSSRRSLNSYTSPSALSVHDSARLGDILPLPGSGRTSASCSANRMPNGVIWGGAVDGSNHVGAIVTCQATVTSPAGAACAATPRAAPKVAATNANSATMRMGLSPMGRLASSTFGREYIRLDGLPLGRPAALRHAARRLLERVAAAGDAPGGTPPRSPRNLGGHLGRHPGDPDHPRPDRRGAC